MKNGQSLPNYNDKCPIHDGEKKKTYEFGKFDATVTTFRSCGCAICHQTSGMNEPPQYYTDYSQAAGRARMIQQQEGGW